MLKRRDDQFQAVVERHDAESGRKEFLLMNLLDLVLHRLHDFSGIASAQHQDDAGDDFTLPVQDRRAVPHRMADLHLGHVPAHRPACRAPL